MQGDEQTAPGVIRVCVCTRARVPRLCWPPPGCRLSALRPRPVDSDGDGCGESGDAAADGRSGRPVPWQLLVSCLIRTKAQEEAGAVSQKKHNSAGLGGVALCRSPSPPPTPGRVPCDCPVGAHRGSVQPPGGDCWSSAMRGGASACCRESSCSGPPRMAFLGRSVNVSQRPLRWVHMASRGPPRGCVAGRECAE